MNLDLKDNYKEIEEKEEKQYNIHDDVEIVVDPEMEDESTVDINDYLNKHILQCRICGNMFPSSEILDAEEECPICGSTSSNGFIYKGKLLNKDNKLKDEEHSEEDQSDSEMNDNINDTDDFNSELPEEITL